MKGSAGGQKPAQSAKSAHPHKTDGRTEKELYTALESVVFDAIVGAIGPIKTADFFDRSR